MKDQSRYTIVHFQLFLAMILILEMDLLCLFLGPRELRFRPSCQRLIFLGGAHDD